eukprot:scaffold1954_cov268-Pinguiococcus_pyrenoidosus.AAC.151
MHSPRSWCIVSLAFGRGGSLKGRRMASRSRGFRWRQSETTAMRTQGRFFCRLDEDRWHAPGGVMYKPRRLSLLAVANHAAPQIHAAAIFVKSLIAPRFPVPKHVS